MSVHYHGTPITPKPVLAQLAGRHFCVSYARPDNIKTCFDIGQSVMLDNGAFSTWRRKLPTDWPGWRLWVEKWLPYRTTWAVIPDSITGDEAENDRLLRQWGDLGSQGAPVWHLHESLGRLVQLCSSYERVCFGSSGEYAQLNTPQWHQRISEAFDAIADSHGRVPWIHMLRGMAQAGSKYPFASLDSTDIARNHNRCGGNSRLMADRWDALQCPARWLS